MSIILAEPPQAMTSTNSSPDELALHMPPIEERMGPGRFPGVWNPFRSLFWLFHLTFGTACLIMVLAILAAIPGLNILTLGYLIDPQKRVAESGRLRDGFPLMVLAPRLGCIVFFSLLLLTPIRFQAVRVSDAAVILGAHHPRVVQMQTTLQVMQWIIAIHLLLAIFRGGTVGCFLRPFKNIIWFLRKSLTRRGRSEISAGTEQVLQLVKPLQHFWIGLKSFIGAVLWLLIPTSLLVVYSAPGRTEPIFGLLSFLGGILMIPVMAWLPQLQVHQAVTGRFTSIFSIRAARQVVRNAPWSWVIASVLLYAMTLPLYLAKIKLLPADALLVLTPFFIVLIYPARIMVAWAYHRGMNTSKAAKWPYRWASALMMLPLLAGYATFLFATPLISELGKAAPLENQAFLGPVPYAQWARK
ncbi:MAG: hypothetical protein KDB01_08835 [Planctomycetaceae bacterium]|nr:hypothetical protein [Planctomycetaceae bacterium]